MANYNRKGFWPADSQRVEYRLYPVLVGNGTNIFVGDVVSAVTGGGVTPSTAGDGANSLFVGTVVELFDSQNTVQGQNAPVPVGAWASTVSTKYLPLSTAGYAMVALAKPGVKFIAQSATAITAAGINKSTNLVAGAGSTTTAQSAHTLNGNDLNTGYDFIVLGPWSQLNTFNNDITLTTGLWMVEFAKGINWSRSTVGV